MAYAIMHFFPDGTKEQYEASIAGASEQEAPCQKAKSFTRRVRLPADGKLWRFTILWEAGSAFATARFYPKMQKGIPGGFAGPPTESGFEVHNLGRARHAYFCRSAVLFAARRM